MNNLKNLLQDIIPDKNITELKYFHPTGREMEPSGHVIQKGGFFKECKDNKNSFSTKKSQYLIDNKFNLIEGASDLSISQSCIIVFPTDTNNIDVWTNIIMTWFSEKIKSNETNYYETRNNDHYVGTFSVGNFFIGEYQSDNGGIFNEKSVTIELSGLNNKGMIDISKMITDEFNLEAILLKDLNRDIIFLVKSSNGLNGA
ncbi:MAG: hypothetical protein WC121_08510 [Candidatus Kapaibacterium sp.]